MREPLRFRVQRFLSATRTPGKPLERHRLSRALLVGGEPNRSAEESKSPGVAPAGRAQSVTQTAFKKREEEVTEQIVFNPLGRK